MNFTFSEEQQQFADALRRYLDERYGFDARCAIVHSDAGVSADQWRAFAELGPDRAARAGSARRFRRRRSRHARRVV